MKKIIIALLAVVILLNITSCAVDDVEYSYSIKDALKISAYLFDGSINMDEPIYYDTDTVYTLEQLKMDETRVMAPQGELSNLETGGEISQFGLVLFLEFDGIIKVVSENKDVRLQREKSTGYELQLAAEGYVCAYPYRFATDSLSDMHTFIVGTEYYLNINAYKFDNAESPLIRAKLKLTVLEDAVCDEWLGEPSSMCVSIELISYEYSDVYKIMDEIVDDEEDE